jgi:serine/threonine protein kinase
MSNLLYTRRGILKVGDFGLARFVGSPPSHLTPTVITLWYRPPELLLGAKEYDEAVDMWSVGCVFGELLSGKPLFPGKSEIDQCHRIFELLGVPTSKIWAGLPSLPLAEKIKDWGFIQPYNNIITKFPSLTASGQQLLDQLLTYDPDKRITARGALSHPYFLEFPLPKTSDLMPTFPSYHTMSEEECRKRKSRIQRPPSPQLPEKKKRKEIIRPREHNNDGNHRFDLSSDSLFEY